MLMWAPMRRLKSSTQSKQWREDAPVLVGLCDLCSSGLPDTCCSISALAWQPRFRPALCNQRMRCIYTSIPWHKRLSLRS